QQARTAVKSLQDLDALLKAHGQVCDPLAWIHLEAEPPGQLVDLAACLVEVDDAAIGDLVAQHDVLGHGKRRDEHEMLVDHADAEPDGVERSPDLDGLTVERDLPRIRANEAID